MALKAQDFVKHNNEKIAKEADAIEAQIDAALPMQYDTTMNIATIDVTVPTRLRGIIKDRYRKAGWDLKYEDDQRDGSWIELKPSATRSVRGDDSDEVLRG